MDMVDQLYQSYFLKVSMRVQLCVSVPILCVCVRICVCACAPVLVLICLCTLMCVYATWGSVLQVLKVCYWHNYVCGCGYVGCVGEMVDQLKNGIGRKCCKYDVVQLIHLPCLRTPLHLTSTWQQHLHVKRVETVIDCGLS